nr:unnamed protein product [Spirometra erinaceieuropaei]
MLRLTLLFSRPHPQLRALSRIHLKDNDRERSETKVDYGADIAKEEAEKKKKKKRKKKEEEEEDEEEEKEKEEEEEEEEEENETEVRVHSTRLSDCYTSLF